MGVPYYRDHLASQGASLLENALRTWVFAQRVVAHLDATQPGLPFVIVRASVCRPAWLVEMEGTAIVEDRDSRWPAC